MTKTPGKLIPKVPSPKVPSVPGAVSRRAHYSATTKRALIDVAEELFTANGYAGTSLDSIVAGARVTKGALYHHFSGKRAVFEAVFDRVESQAGQTITQALKRQRDPWSRAMAGLEAFLEVVQQPTYRRIVIQDGPSVMGYERFRELEERSTFATMTDIVRALLKAGDWDVDEAMLKTFTTIFFGAMSSAGESVATSDDTAQAAARVEAAIGFLLAGLQGLADRGAAGPSPHVDDEDEPEAAGD
ncbi:TetR/AcrR family transcriptional regulator [Nocardioides gansuensis]|uniref:TetR/AcrR family transcriptional regulator n=1 Tax=Nocardioides gansuensis TaxID=2138300 RepID=A0A2T8F5W6_9ACTN|nr:TetR/AcrR family transcriptional regulator [Nocardioides gansuensis]PVG81097.1 TetR/AcrR family transcriptional regulator [Nocardioides gansuensis]